MTSLAVNSKSSAETTRDRRDDDPRRGSVAVVARKAASPATLRVAAGVDAFGRPTGGAGDVLLSAGKDIRLTSVEAEGRSESASRSFAASVGVGASIGGSGGGSGGLEASVSASSAKGTSTWTRQLNAHVAGTGTVSLLAGKDIDLEGAVVAGHRVVARAGGDLTIASRQDTATYDERALGGSLSVGGGGVSGGVRKDTVTADYANVAEQSGLFAGSGGYDVAVGGAVSLKGGAIASTAQDALNSLVADSLAFSDIENHSRAKAKSIGLALGPEGLPIPQVGQPVKEESAGTTRATLTPGSLTLAHRPQDLAALNTDLSKAGSQVAPYDIDRLKARQQSAAALSELLNLAVGDLSSSLHLEEGQPAKVALHAAVGALVSELAGNGLAAGALSGAASEIANGVLKKVLEADPTLTAAQRTAITDWVAAAVGAATGGEAGAATALDNVNYNYLTHEQAAKKAETKRRLAACQADPGTCTETEVGELKATLAELNRLEKETTLAALTACASGSPLTCLAYLNRLEEVYGTKTRALPGKVKTGFPSGSA